MMEFPYLSKCFRTPNQIGRLGQLQEWLEDKDDPKEKHRHVSHLWGCILARRLRGTALDLLRPLKSLGFAATAAGWRWAVITSAQLDGDHAFFMLSNQLRLSACRRTCLTPIRRSRLTATSCGGIVEMLLQSHAGLSVLPARRRRAVGLFAACVSRRFEVDIEWHNGRLKLHA